MLHWCDKQSLHQVNWKKVDPMLRLDTSTLQRVCLFLHTSPLFLCSAQPGRRPRSEENIGIMAHFAIIKSSVSAHIFRYYFLCEAGNVNRACNSPATAVVWTAALWCGTYTTRRLVAGVKQHMDIPPCVWILYGHGGGRSNLLANQKLLVPSPGALPSFEVWRCPWARHHLTLTAPPS